MSEAVRLAPYALSTVAQETIGDVSEAALSRLAGREDQVGFNLAQFLENIREPGALEVIGGHGHVGILDQERMGTAADFEEIGDQFIKHHLWHQGTGQGEVFRQAVFDDPIERDRLAQDRQAVWGTKTPQWYLMENGFSGGGEYPPVPAAHFIASSTRADKITLRLINTMRSLFRGIPRS